MTTFRCDENGDLWFNDWNRGSDDHARQQMVLQAEFYENAITIFEGGTFSVWRLQCAEECRQALADYDQFWAEDDEQLRYETEMGS